MKLKRFARLVAVVAVLMAVSLVACFYRLRSASCKERGNAYWSRAENLKREAHEKLTVGTKKDAVIRFFAENGLPVTFIPGEATGTVQTVGCAPAGCGSDAALLGLRVKVDEAGTVIGDPLSV